MLFVGTSIIHPSTEGVFLLCNILDLLIYSKKVTSIGVRDNIHIVRIAKAKELLMQGMSVQEIAEKVGYVESRALIRTFKRYEGVTPGQYRETMVQK